MRVRGASRPVVVGAALAVLLAAASPGASAAGSPALCGAAGPAPWSSHVIVVVAENAGYSYVPGASSGVLGNPAAPFQNGVLALQCGAVTGMRAITHFSEPNYLGLLSGGYPAWANREQPPLDGRAADPAPTLLSELEAAGRTWKTYAESMPAPCARTDSADGRYVARHNPAVYFTGLADCAARDVAMGAWRSGVGAFAADLSAGQLPDLSLVVPNQVHNSHDGNAAQFDAWLSAFVSTVAATPAYAAGDLSVVVTNDEGCTDGSCGPASAGQPCWDPASPAQNDSCRIPCWVLSRYATPGPDPDGFLSHYGLLATLQAHWGLARLGHSGDAGLTLLATRYPSLRPLVAAG